MADLVKKIRTSSGDLQIDYNALANLPTISNPNLLINSDFRNPINQRGKTTYKSNPNDSRRIYTVDRWNMQLGCECTVNDGFITLKGDSSFTGTQSFCQIFEKLPIGTYTLQVKVKSLSNGANIQMSNGTAKPVITDALYVGLNKYTVSNTDLAIVSIQLGSKSIVELEWIKLEAGSVQTSFSPRPYAEELSLCKRYCRVIDFKSGDILCYLKYRDTNQYGGFISFDTMRIKPIVQKIGQWHVEVYNSSNVEPIHEDSLNHLHIVPQLSGLKFGIGLETQYDVNYLAVYSESSSLILDAEFDSYVRDAYVNV